MNYLQIDKSSISNGPGVRVVLWVSGCSIRCNGCQNQESWSFNAGKLFDLEAEQELLQALDKPYIKGITFSGGNPLELKHLPYIYGIISKIKSLTSETVLIDCLVSYLKKYKEVKGVNHPDISMACLSDFLETADYLFDGYYDDLKADDGFEKMIDRHFACRYKQKIDYKFQHFASSKILEYQARYFGYIDGYKE